MPGMLSEQYARRREASGVFARIRIGPLSVLTLLVVIALAIFSVLALYTAHASLVISQRQADSVSERYLAEAAAQSFTCDFDASLAVWREAGGRQSGARALEVAEQSLAHACEVARAEARGRVSATASVEADAVNAQFATEGGQILTVQLALDEDGAFSVRLWEMGAVHNEKEPEGNLLIVDESA